MNDRSTRNKDYIQYSSAGVQMVMTILIFTYLGVRLDRHFETKPLWTAILAILGVIIAMIFMVKSFMKPPKKTDVTEKKDKNEVE